MNKASYAIAATLCACALSSCFTGIESTPRIGAAELRKQHVNTTPEQEFLSEVVSLPPLQWQPGKQFYVTDSKIKLIFTSASTGTDSLATAVIEFCRFDSVPAVDSHATTELILTHGDDTLRYRPGFDFDMLGSRGSLDIPFTVDLATVDEVRSKLIGNTYYISTPLWYDSDTLQATHGLRHVPVTVTDVQPGTADMPMRIIFSCPLTGQQRHCVLMTCGHGPLATRNFASIFSFENPRKRFSNISDENWQLIINSKVAEGMTRDECRLALGAPVQIVYGSGTNATVERWSYPDGVYLIFDDGFLSRFRQ